jgi:hypothetical protein
MVQAQGTNVIKLFWAETPHHYRLECFIHFHPSLLFETTTREPVHSYVGVLGLGAK